MADADAPDDYYSSSKSEFEPGGSAEQSANDDSDDSDSGSLSLASAARIEALTCELNAIKRVIKYCVGGVEADASQIWVWSIGDGMPCALGFPHHWQFQKVVMAVLKAASAVVDLWFISAEDYMDLKTCRTPVVPTASGPVPLARPASHLATPSDPARFAPEATGAQPGAALSSAAAWRRLGLWVSGRHLGWLGLGARKRQL